MWRMTPRRRHLERSRPDLGTARAVVAAFRAGEIGLADALALEEVSAVEFRRLLRQIEGPTFHFRRPRQHFVTPDERRELRRRAEALIRAHAEAEGRPVPPPPDDDNDHERKRAWLIAFRDALAWQRPKLGGQA